MGKSLFIASILTVTSGLVVTFSYLKAHFSGASYLKQKAVHLKKQAEEDRLKLIVTESQLLELKAEVMNELYGASYLKKPTTKNYSLRNLASISGANSTEKVSEFYEKFKSKRLFLRAKKSFIEKNFTEAILGFNELIEKYPSSPYIVKSYYLLSESLYLTGDQGRFVDAVDQMVSLFPGDELTGHVLLKLGDLYTTENRLEEASEIYTVIIKSYKPFAKIVTQARESRRAL